MIFCPVVLFFPQLNLGVTCCHLFEVSGCEWLSLKLNWKKKSYHCWYYFLSDKYLCTDLCRALVVQIARVIFSGVSFCRRHGWI